MGIGFLARSSFTSPLQVLSRWLAPRAFSQARPGNEFAVGDSALCAAEPSYLRALSGEHIHPSKFTPDSRFDMPTLRPQRPEHGKVHATVKSAFLAGDAKQAHRPLPPSTHAMRRPPARHALRVVHSSCNNGFDKLFISGRMADVCAELDRLAAQEAMA